MAARRNIPPIADAGLPANPAVAKIDGGIGKTAACMLKYQAMVAADIDQALALVHAHALVSRTAIDAWTVSELDKVRSIYGRCAECVRDWLDRQQWETLQLAAALVPPADIGAAAGGGGPVSGPAIGLPPPGQWCMELSQPTVSNQPFVTSGGGLAGSGINCTLTAGPYRLAGPFATQAAAQLAMAAFPAGTQGNYYFPQTWTYPSSSAWWVLGYFSQCQPCGVPPPGGPCVPTTIGPPGTHWDPVLCAWVADAACLPVTPCPAGQRWDPIKCKCVPIVVTPPPDDSACCPLPGQRVTIYSDNTWSLEGDIADFPQIAALLAGVLKIIARDDPPAEEAEWELDDGPPEATPDLAEITWLSPKTPIGSM